MTEITNAEDDFLSHDLKALVRETDKKLNDAKKMFNSELEERPKRRNEVDGLSPLSMGSGDNYQDRIGLLSPTKQEYSLSDTDDCTPADNPAASLTTPQARAMAMEGYTTAKKAPASTMSKMSKNLFEESFSPISTEKNRNDDEKPNLLNEIEKKLKRTNLHSPANLEINSIIDNKYPMVVTTSTADSAVSPLHQASISSSLQVAYKDTAFSSLKDTKNMATALSVLNELDIPLGKLDSSVNSSRDTAMANSSDLTQSNVEFRTKTRQKKNIDGPVQSKVRSRSTFGTSDVLIGDLKEMENMSTKSKDEGINLVDSLNLFSQPLANNEIEVGLEPKVLYSTTPEMRQKSRGTNKVKFSIGRKEKLQEKSPENPSSAITSRKERQKESTRNKISRTSQPGYMMDTQNSLQSHSPPIKNSRSQTPKPRSPKVLVNKEIKDATAKARERVLQKAKASKSKTTKVPPHTPENKENQAVSRERSKAKTPMPKRKSPKTPAPVLSPEAKEGMAKARERVKQRKLDEQKRKGREKAQAAKEEGNIVPTRTRLVTINSPDKSIGRLAQKQSQVDAQIKMQEERRRRIASKVRSEGAGLTIPRPPRLSGSNVYVPKPTISSVNRARLAPVRNQTPNRQIITSRITTPVPFHFHGPSPSRVRAKNLTTLAEKTQAFGMGLRESKTPVKISRPRITTPKPFKFHESRTTSLSRSRANSTPKPRKAQTMAECINDFGQHLRDIPTGPERDITKPTVPISPNFSVLHKHDKVKSTAEKEQEVVDYYNSHKFKAAPILTEQLSKRPVVPRIPKKKLTIPKPFNLSRNGRASTPRRNIENDIQPNARSNLSGKSRFRARPMPNFSSTRR